uniref:Uncharacterized protein n=1 Tax=Meloidogyne incognita TaxID=6306 RepID=A0A914MLB5_MELIC
MKRNFCKILRNLLVVMVNTTSRWPVTTGISGLQKAISFFEQEMILDQLSLNFFGHPLQRIIGPTKLGI